MLNTQNQGNWTAQREAVKRSIKAVKKSQPQNMIVPVEVATSFAEPYTMKQVAQFDPQSRDRLRKELNVDSKIQLYDVNGDCL